MRGDSQGRCRERLVVKKDKGMEKRMTWLAGAQEDIMTGGLINGMGWVWVLVWAAGRLVVLELGWRSIRWPG